MSYNFINENLNSILSGNKVDLASLGFYMSSEGCSFILNHNVEGIERLLTFLNNPDQNLFVLNGFMGSGKTLTAEFIILFVSDEVLFFKNSYQEAINTDDLLSLFKDFSNYHSEGRIHLPKVETNVFSEKINAFIKSCNAPMLFVFDSFEINMRNKESQNDILHFINYLTRFEKVKIIICSRSFRVDDLLSNIGATSYLLTSVSKDDVKNYLEENNVQATNYEADSLFKMIRGHFLLLELAVLVMTTLDLSLNLFLNEYKKSTKNLLDFLMSKVLSVSSEKFVKALLFLASIRHAVSGEFLIFQNIITIENLEFLLQKKIISEKFDKYYLKDYLKSEFLKGVSPASKIKVHEYIINLYEAELPLKPFERGLFLSRQTMRQEISYHKKRIETLTEELIKSGKGKGAEAQGISYLSYSKTSGFDADIQQKKINVKQSLKAIKRTPQRQTAIDKDKVDKILMTMPKEVLAKDLEEVAFSEDVVVDINPLDKVPDSIDDYIEIANNYQKAFNFSNAILYYKKALSFKTDISFNEKQPLIYLQLALCNKKIQDIDEAEALYEKAYQLYLPISVDKANEILIDVARMYSELFKFDKAKEVYNRIIYSKEKVSKNILIRVYLDLAEIEESNANMDLALNYSQKAMVEAEKSSDVKLLSECYFKHALHLDDVNNIEFAMKYYLRCVQVANNPEENKYLSLAYSNLAGISIDNKNVSAAKMYYELAIEADKKTNNIEGLYYSYNKLAKLYKKENLDKSYECLLNALAAAKKFDDLTYAISIYIEIGNYYINKGDFKKALKSYILAKTLTPLHSEENLNENIISKINKVKSLVGEKMFSQLLDEIKKKR